MALPLASTMGAHAESVPTLPRGSGSEPLPDPDIIDLIIRPLKLSERAPTRKRVLEKIMDYVLTFIQGIAA